MSFKQIAVALTFQDGVTKDEVQEFILNLSDNLVKDGSKVRIDDILGMEEYDTVTEYPTLKIYRNTGEI